MGIPSFFAYVIRNHMRGVLLHPREWRTRKINGLYMDCNSLIYESIQWVQEQMVASASVKSEGSNRLLLPSTTTPAVAVYKQVGAQVCRRIETLVEQIAPQNFVYISFDGVAPYAKMQHQRTRRYRGEFIDRMISETSAGADRAASVGGDMGNVRAVIGTPTPGTPFMVWFSTYVTSHFRSYKQRRGGHLEVLLSTSDEVGEGEQKLFEHARQRNTPHMDYAVYGLDADLFMLCLVHSEQYGKFHVVREAPEFIKSLKCELEPNQLYMLDMQEFARSILQEMRLHSSSSSSSFRQGGAATSMDRFPMHRKIMDYVFLCFLLGNDFLPKFPAINIRSHGIQLLLDVYREYWRTRPECNLHGFLTYWHTDSRTWRIHWGNFSVFVQRLSAEEPAAFQREHRRLIDQRIRREKVNPLGEFWWSRDSILLPDPLAPLAPLPPLPSSSAPPLLRASVADPRQDPSAARNRHYAKDKDEDPHDYNLIPQSFRQKEMYINPEVAGWQSRYYEALFCDNHHRHHHPLVSIEDQVVIPYLRTLAWTLQYYTGPCRNWRWGYTPYHYAPLLQDLSAFMQQDAWKQSTPKQRDRLLTEPSALQMQAPWGVAEQLAYVIPPMGVDGDVPRIQLRDFDWSYCQYFWEAHISFPSCPPKEPPSPLSGSSSQGQ